MQYEWDENKRLANLERHKVHALREERIRIISLRKANKRERNIMKNYSTKTNKTDWDAVESPSLSDDLLSKMKPISEEHPNNPKRVRGPQKEPVKVPVSIRLNPDVVDYFKSQGKGWHTRINDILDEYIKTQK